MTHRSGHVKHLHNKLRLPSVPIMPMGRKIEILVVFFYAKMKPEAAELLTFHMAAEKTLCALAF